VGLYGLRRIDLLFERRGIHPEDRHQIVVFRFIGWFRLLHRLLIVLGLRPVLILIRRVSTDHLHLFLSGLGAQPGNPYR
jgi:hypothetical protein